MTISYLDTEGFLAARGAGLRPTLSATLRALLRYADISTSTGICWPSLRRLAADLSESFSRPINYGTVARWLDALADLGLVQRINNDDGIYEARGGRPLRSCVRQVLGIEDYISSVADDDDGEAQQNSERSELGNSESYSAISRGNARPKTIIEGEKLPPMPACPPSATPTPEVIEVENPANERTLRSLGVWVGRAKKLAGRINSEALADLIIRGEKEAENLPAWVCQGIEEKYALVSDGGGKKRTSRGKASGKAGQPATPVAGAGEAAAEPAPKAPPPPSAPADPNEYVLRLWQRLSQSEQEQIRKDGGGGPLSPKRAEMLMRSLGLWGRLIRQDAADTAG